MSFDVPPVARPFATPSVDPVRRAPDSTQASFADAARDATTPPIPAEVWEEVDAAARLAEELHAQGRGVRFDVHNLDGRVVAELVDDSGLLRPLLLQDVVDVDRLQRLLDEEPT